MRIVCIEWVDAQAHYGWISPEDYTRAAPPLTVHSIGYLVTEDAQQVSITTSIGDNGEVADPLSIPKRSILKRRWVKL